MTLFGLPLQPGALASFLKVRACLRACEKMGTGSGQPVQNPENIDPQPVPVPIFSQALSGRRRANTQRLAGPVPAAALADKAATSYGRFVNPVFAGLGKMSGLAKTFVRGQENELFDADGRAYLDFVAGFGSLNLGHNHPAVVRAVQEALAQQAPGFSPASINPLTAAPAAKLVALAPPGLEMVFFCNSGTEAVEAAIKLARAASGRTDLLYCERSFHGKSLGALSVTGNLGYQRPFALLVPGCHAVPFGDEEALDRLLASRRFAAFIVEPIQGEGGIRLPPAGYLRSAQVLCRKTGTLLIADEVQTGIGRTGKLFAVEHDGIEPDLMTLAKSLGGGVMPIGAMLARRGLHQKAYGCASTFALHTNTFGGGSLACAAALATLDVLVADNLPARAAAQGRELLAGLESLCLRHPVLREVRGRGLLLGVEFEPMSDHMYQHLCAHRWPRRDGLVCPQFRRYHQGLSRVLCHAVALANPCHLHANDAIEWRRLARPAAVDDYTGPGATLLASAGIGVPRNDRIQGVGGSSLDQNDWPNREWATRGSRQRRSRTGVRCFSFTFIKSA